MMWSSHGLTCNLIHISSNFLTYHITGPLPLELPKHSGFTQFKLDDYWEYTPYHSTTMKFSPTQLWLAFVRLLSWNCRSATTNSVPHPQETTSQQSIPQVPPRVVI